MMHPTVKAARIAGAVYLALVLVAPFAMLYVPGKLIVRGNATATADNILAHETTFRLSILGDLRRTRHFHLPRCRALSSAKQCKQDLGAAAGGVCSGLAAVGFLNTLNNIAALILVPGGEFLDVIDKTQRDASRDAVPALAQSGRVHQRDFSGASGSSLSVLLVFRSGFLPRILGIWLIIACFAWVALSITAQFFPASYSAAFGWLQPAFFAEMAIMLWLLIRGANVKALPVDAALIR